MAHIELTAPAGVVAAPSPPALGSRANILGVGVDPLTMERAVAEIEGWIARSESRYVTLCTVATIMHCQRSEELRAAVNASGMVTPDGMPLVWLLRRANSQLIGQVCGPDLLPELASRSASTGARHFFYGGAEGVAEKVAENLSGRFPGLEVAGTLCPPYAPTGDLASDEVAATINSAKADVVWVALGSPKQEEWIRAMRPRLTAPVLIGVGAAFDFHSGRVPRAAGWMRSAGLEWLHRLFQEPRRLWRRYLFDNPAFLYLVALQQLHLRVFPLD